MADYNVKWEIEISADTPEEAAREARRCQTRAGTTAVVFDVTPEYDGHPTRVDLLELREDADPDPEDRTIPGDLEPGTEHQDVAGEIVARLDAFNRRCIQDDYTPTDEVWDLLEWARKRLTGEGFPVSDEPGTPEA